MQFNGIAIFLWLISEGSRNLCRLAGEGESGMMTHEKSAGS